jgi:hypothetical protein
MIYAWEDIVIKDAYVLEALKEIQSPAFLFFKL